MNEVFTKLAAKDFVCICCFLCTSFVFVSFGQNIVFYNMFLFQVDAMKLGVKQMKKEYKKVDIDQIEVCAPTIIKREENSPHKFFFVSNK